VTTDRSRQRKLILGIVILILCGVLYYCFVKITGVGIPCLFRLVTGLKCPGCGISHMLLELAEGNLAGAFMANQFILVTLPFLIFEVAYAFYLAWTGKHQPKWNEILCIIYIIALVIFGIVRNIPQVYAWWRSR